MATSTGKAARARYGNRFAAKRRRDAGAKRPRVRRTFGKLPYSVVAGNVPQGAVSANEALIARIAQERGALGWGPEDNVPVPGPRKASGRRAAEEKFK